MKWSKLDWFNIIKQLFILGLGYSLLRMGIIMLNYYEIFGKTLLPQPWEVAVLIIAGRLFELIYSKLAGALQRRLAFFFCIFALVLYGAFPANLFEFDFSGFMRLVTICLSFMYGASVNTRIQHYDMLNRLKIYTALLLLLSFFVKSPKLFEEILPILFMHMILSLIILAFYNMEQVGSTMPEHYAGSMRKRWLWLVTAVSAVLSAGAGLIFSAYNPFYPGKLFNVLNRFYSPFVDIIVKIITPVVAPIIYILGFIINILKRLARFQEPEPVTVNPGGNSIFAHAEYRGLPSAATSFFKAMILIAVVAGFAVLLVLILRKFLPVVTEDVEEIRESVFEWKNVRKNIVASIRRLTHIHRARKETVEFFDSPAFMVRRIYVDLLRKVKQRGCERKPSKTPAEFSVCITVAYGEECGESIRGITEAYNRTRYHPLSVTEEDEKMAKNCLADLVTGWK